ncbi:MAG TPA: hypothetical protein VMT27_01265, partial [Actinomycetes bacterium]|nr:hypothetical protein [Actinomycetes bacterium]
MPLASRPEGPPWPPVEPPRTRWRLPDVARLGEDDAGHDLLAVGADLEPGTVLAAYRSGLFPMHVDVSAPADLSSRVGWWSPDPRGVLPLDNLRVSRSLRRSLRRFRV